MLKQAFRLVLLMAVCLLSGIAESVAGASGHFTLVEGRVDVLKKNADVALAVQSGDAVEVGDIVRTKSKSRAQITLQDNSILNLGESSRMEIRRFSFSGGAEQKRDGMFHLFRGQLRSIVHRNEEDKAFNFQVETPTAVAAVRGTDYSARVSSDALSYFACRSGQVAIQNRNPNIRRSVLIGANQFTQVRAGLPPSTPRAVPPGMMREMFSRSAPAETDVASGTDGGAVQQSETQSAIEIGTETTTDTDSPADAVSANATDMADETSSDPSATPGDMPDSAPSASAFDGSSSQSEGGLPDMPDVPLASTGNELSTPIGISGASIAPATAAAPEPLVKLTPTVLTPITPPITSTTPAILTSPVTIQVNF